MPVTTPVRRKIKKKENKNAINDHSWESPEYKNQFLKDFLSQSC